MNAQRVLFSLTLLGIASASSGTVCAQSSCGLGSAVQFDGVDDRIMVPYSASYPTEVFSACAWINASMPTTRGAIIARGEDDDSYDLSWALYVRANGVFEVMLEDSVGPGMNQMISSGVDVIDGTWHHVAATRDLAGTLSLYVDGVLAHAEPGTVVPSADNFHDLSIGCSFGMIGPPPSGQPEPPIWFFRGKIDEVAMWQRALNSAQIQAVVADSVDSASADLRGYWKLDEGSGQDVADLSPAANHGYFGTVAAAIDSADPIWAEGDTGGVTSYCISAANSVGAGALLSATGSTSIAANDFTLTVSAAIPGNYGLFFYSAAQQQVPFGDGYLCVGPGVYRLGPPLASDGSGQAQRDVDFTLPPVGSGPGQVHPGSTWNFQYWYRDPAGAGSGFNLSDGLRVVFCH